LNRVQQDIGMMKMVYAKLVMKHVKLVMVLPKMTVLIVKSEISGYTTNNVLNHALMVIMETTLQSVNHVTPLVKLVFGQEAINVVNVKKDTINNQVMDKVLLS
jgi:hypothetical protein